MIQKAKHLRADMIVFDLEDSVPLADKDAARATVRQAIAELAGARQRVVVRINSLATGLAYDDLEAVIVPGLCGINQPKPGDASDVAEVAEMVDRLEKERGIEKGYVGILPWVETAKGILNAYHIANASPRVLGIIFGAEDFALDTGIIRTAPGDELLYPRMAVVIAARAAGVCAIDTPYNDFKNEAGLIREAMVARGLGFEGKFLIHPGQIESVNRIFRPNADEVARAKEVVEAFDAAAAQGIGATSIDGRMIDAPIANQSRRLLAIADAIERSEGNR